MFKDNDESLGSTHQQAAGTTNVEVNPGPQNVPIETVFAKILSTFWLMRLARYLITEPSIEIFFMIKQHPVLDTQAVSVATVPKSVVDAPDQMIQHSSGDGD